MAQWKIFQCESGECILHTSEQTVSLCKLYKVNNIHCDLILNFPIKFYVLYKVASEILIPKCKKSDYISSNKVYFGMMASLDPLSMHTAVPMLVTEDY